MPSPTPRTIDEALLALLRDEADRREARRRHDWTRNARSDQLLPDGDWRTWLILAGRGWGKTRTGAETVRSWVAQGYRRIALVGPTAGDTRDVLVEGESGLLNIHPEHERPLYEPSKRRVTFANGAIATLYSADEPNRLRGPQHDAAWADELAAWRRPDDAWSNLMMGLRLGGNPRVVVTTTPRPIPIVRQLAADQHTHLTRGRTLDNSANLPAQFLDQILAKYQGTRLGRQELDAEVLEDVEGALWTFAQLDALRVEAAPELRRVVVAVDPAATATGASDYTAIVVAGVAADERIYVLAAEQLRTGPAEWARRAWALFDHYRADRLVLETNQGGDMGIAVLRQARGKGLAPIAKVSAKRGKTLRAEPIAHLYELGRIHHVGPPAALRDLEDQMTTFPVASEHDDLVDALVHAATELAGRQSGISIGSGWR